MRKRSSLLFLIFCFCGLSISCEKIEPPESEFGELAFEDAVFTDAIPVDYGELVAVTTNLQSLSPKYTEVRWTNLWFESPEDQTITVVWVNTALGKTGDQVLVIPRR